MIVESDDTQRLKLDDHEIAVATAAGTKIERQFVLPGEVHFLVIGYGGVTVDVANSKSQPSSTRSWSQGYLEGFAGSASNADSRVAQARAREKFTARVKGAGCFVLMTFQRY